MKDLISWEDFSKIDIRVGTIVGVTNFPEVRNPAFKLEVNFGEEIGIKKTSAQITKLYSKEDLLGKQVTAVVNFPKKQIANFMSECLILGAVDGKDVTLLQPTEVVSNGLKVS
ncbi:tRNA-binding protein [uncultured Maribacter sp.]|uniref:tRNA-binding protein n=1 Tax=uncultured Maribacter sp. TaxID=431308 RepID=UPI002617E5C6|nr:tRNA-binding protein [uncultured Maribacter sp.]